MRLFRSRSIKKNLLWLFVIVLCTTFIFIIVKDYTIVYIKLKNNKTAIAITTRDNDMKEIKGTDASDPEITTSKGKSHPLKSTKTGKKNNDINNNINGLHDKTWTKTVFGIEGSHSSLNEINSVSIYIDHVLNKIQDAKKKEEERKYLMQYNNERNKIIAMLPKVTQQNSETTFHVLVDHTSKPSRSDHKYDLIVLVSSQVSNFERRTLIRKLWGNITLTINKNWKVFFICGGTNRAVHMARVHKEAITQKDIMVEDFMESWSENMGKKVMTALQWVTANFVYDYILKSDDDVFVDIDAILKRVHTLVKPTKDVLMGNVMYGQPVERAGRYAISLTEHPAPAFKQYCSGGGYVLSSSLIKKLIPIFEWEHPLRIDDAYIGEMVNELGSRPMNQPGFLMWNDNCEYQEDLVVTHPARDKNCQEKLQKIVSGKKDPAKEGVYVKYQK